MWQCRLVGLSVRRLVDIVNTVDKLDTVDNISTMDSIDMVNMKKTYGYLKLLLDTQLTWWTWKACLT
jgi:hypothetical protein